MAEKPNTLSGVCAENLLHTKWLLAPSHRVGHQWMETLVRNGQSAVNLRTTVVPRLALEIVGPELAKDGLAVANRSVGSLVVDAAWSELSREGYLGRLAPSANLSDRVYASLLSLRLAGFTHASIDESRLESTAKANDIVALLRAYEDFLQAHALVDEADVLRRAAARLNAEPRVLADDTLILVPAGFHVTGLDRDFLDALPASVRMEIRHPADQKGSRESVHDGSVRFFRAIGESNEIREVLRRCLAEERPLDDVEILHTDAATYVPLIYATALRYCSQRDRPGGIPVTFAEGIPTSLSRPGRALVAWLNWIAASFEQRLLVDMIGEGLLNCGDDETSSFGYLVRLLRPIAIGLGADNYLPKLNEQIRALRKAAPTSVENGNDDSHDEEARERKLAALRSLRKIIRQLLKVSRDFSLGSGSSILEAAENFLVKSARSVSELDRYAAEALIEQIRDRRLWLERLGVAPNPVQWLAALPSRTCVLGSGPQPGHLHVANIGSGGHSSRQQTFVVGLDDRRFPGAALQDPILLDRERGGLSPDLSTSSVWLRQRMDDWAVTLARLPGAVTLSWPCIELTDDRETFPSSVALSAYRAISGCHDADLEALNTAVGPPVSFAPTAARKALDEAERWLWRLSDPEVQGTNQTAAVEARFPHLARGSAAERERAAGFGPYNGYVPQAGKDLDPFAQDGPVLSASTLETAGRCPLAFFFRSGLELYRPGQLEIDPERWLDAAQFGLLLHEVFRRFLDELSHAGRRPDFERDHHRLAEILREAVQQWRRDVPPPNENAFRTQSARLVRTSRIFLQAEEEFCKTSQPRYFEVALGLDSEVSGSPLDSEDASIVILPKGKSIRVRGQIDRVDKTGKAKFAVWDYKVGSGHGYDRVDPFRQGRRVQSVLYLRMIEAALRERLDPQAVVQRFGYFFPSIRAHGLRVDWDAGQLAAGPMIVQRLCELMSAGVFPATDEIDDCHYCDYATICRNLRQVTSHSKALLQRNDLVQLQPFRELRRS